MILASTSGTLSESQAAQQGRQGELFESRDFEKHDYANVGVAERWATGVGGAALIGYGLMRRGWSGVAMAAVGGVLLRRAATGYCAMYDALGVEHDEQDALSTPLTRSVQIEQSVTIQRPAHELYQFWRQLENLPRFMTNIDDVKQTSPGRSHWVGHSGLSTQVEWDAQITQDMENQLIAWESLEGSDVDTWGEVRFEPVSGAPGSQENQGTIVRLRMGVRPPAGAVGAAIAKLWRGDPKSIARENLRRFKQLMEAGEIPDIEGQPRGSCG